MKRREFLSLTAASVILPRFAIAENGSAVGYYDFALGDANLTVISGGHMNLPTSMLGNNADPLEVKAMLENAGLDATTNTAALNHVVIRKNDATILVDAGGGARWMTDTANQTMKNLEAAGIDPSSITHVALTHAHPDHIWGVRDDFDEPFLPDAAYLLGAAEMDYWKQDGLVDQVAQEDQQFVLGAVNSIETIEPILERVSNDHEITTGVRMIDTPGHTPGHMSLIVDTDQGALLVTGDAMTHVIMNFLHPQWTQSADIDGEQTIATRMKLLDMAVADKMMVLGYHFPFPGLGYVEKSADQYQFSPLG